ncbi:gamma-glutamyl-gamma-aminobutyrate hydrolase family protein [bacterium]|nr:gamma-glutamyl-gamma-aminobutyrate hydrolase family protein [bacterium]
MISPSRLPGALLVLACGVSLVVAQPATTKKAAFSSGPLSAINDVFDDLTELAPDRPPAVVVLCLKHPDTLRAALAAPPGSGRTNLDYFTKVARLAQETSGLRAVILHYAQLPDEHVFANTCVKALVITAMDRTLAESYNARIRATIRETSLPMIGFCGGCQIISGAFGGAISQMRPLREGEADPNPRYTPGIFKEWGFMPVRVTQRDPLFEGLGDQFVVREMHAWEITRLPECFEVLASTDACRVQVIRHKTRPLYGTQFHPEHATDEYPDGRRLIRNFFVTVGIAAPAVP